MFTAFPTTGRAAGPAVVPFFPCVNGGGTATVSAGTPFVIRWGWFDATRGFVHNFLDAEQLEVTIDGVPLADPTSYHLPVEAVVHPIYGPGYQSLWIYPGASGIALSSGQTLTMTLRIGVAHTVVGTADPGQFGPSFIDGALGPPQPGEPGLAFYGPGWITPTLTCTITGV